MNTQTATEHVFPYGRAVPESARDRRAPHLRSLGTTIFAEMSALALATESINLGQGFPDTDGPEAVREAAVEALRAGKGNQYPPGIGIPELRQAVAHHQMRWCNRGDRGRDSCSDRSRRRSDRS